MHFINCIQSFKSFCNHLYIFFLFIKSIVNYLSPFTTWQLWTFYCYCACWSPGQRVGCIRRVSRPRHWSPSSIPILKSAFEYLDPAVIRLWYLCFNVTNESSNKVFLISFTKPRRRVQSWIPWLSKETHTLGSRVSKRLKGRKHSCLLRRYLGDKLEMALENISRPLGMGRPPTLFSKEAQNKDP